MVTSTQYYRATLKDLVDGTSQHIYEALSIRNNPYSITIAIERKYIYIVKTQTKNTNNVHKARTHVVA